MSLYYLYSLSIQLRCSIFHHIHTRSPCFDFYQQNPDIPIPRTGEFCNTYVLNPVGQRDKSNGRGGVGKPTELRVPSCRKTEA